MATSNRRPPERKPTRTHESAPAVLPGVFPELELTAASTFLNEDTFYEKADRRVERLTDLTAQAVARNATRTASLIWRVRNEYKIRHAALLMACVYVHSGAPGGREVVDSVIQRPDEPAELLAIWQARYGQPTGRPLSKLPNAIRKGAADGLVRTLTEKNYLKYVGQGRKVVSIADAIELTHPKPRGDWQSALFRFALDEAHRGDGMVAETGLSTIWRSRQMGKIEPENRRAVLREDGPQALADAGYTWERLSGWLPGGMDREAWETVIPSMGVMALLWNLRNFDQAKIGDAAYKTVVEKLTDEEEVRKSRIFPYRAYTAYREAPSDRWRWPLNTTVELAAGNVPRWDRTLFLVDVSASMSGRLSAKGTVSRYEVASVMATVASQVSESSDLVVFGTNSHLVPVRAMSPLKVAEEIARNTDVGYGYGRGGWRTGSATYGHTAIAQRYDKARHDRVVIFTDDQMHDSSHLSAHVPSIVYFNLGGYAPQSDWAKNRIHVGGFSDAAFKAARELTQEPI